MSPRAIVRAAVLTSFVTAACGEPVQPEIPPFSVTPSAQWSGGAITLRSSFFVGRQQLPLITSGTGDTLSLTRQDDSTLISNLPLGPSGPVTLALQTGSKSWALAGVQRVGLRESRLLTPSLMGELLVIDSADHPVVFGNVASQVPQYVPVGRLDLVTGAGSTLTAIHGTSSTGYGLSPGVQPGTIVARDTADTLRLYDMLKTPPQPLAKVPFATTGTGYVRHLTPLSPGLWVNTQSHWTFTYGESDTVSYRVMAQTESPWSLFVSPRGDRTTMTVNVGVPGVPVFDNATGSVAFTLPFAGAEGIAFSPDGSVLYAVGGTYYRPDTIVMVDATSGALLHDKVSLPDGFLAFGAAYSTRGGGILLIAAADTTTLALLVYDASTLVLKGVLPTQSNYCGDPRFSFICWWGVIATDDTRNVAYVTVPGASYGTPASPNPVWSFDLLSAP